MGRGSFGAVQGIMSYFFCAKISSLIVLSYYFRFGVLHHHGSFLLNFMCVYFLKMFFVEHSLQTIGLHLQSFCDLFIAEPMRQQAPYCHLVSQQVL
jgi:hypothetical protein